MELAIPKNFSDNPADFQLKSMGASTVISTLSKPTNKNTIGDTVYDIKAFSAPETTVSTFNAPVSVSMNYTESDVSGINETSLKIWRNDDGVWTALDSCTVNTSAKTVTCTTTNFSVFGLFGDSTASAETTVTTVTSGGNGPIVGGGNIHLPNEVAPRKQTIYPDGRVVYEESTFTTETKQEKIAKLLAQINQLKKQLTETNKASSVVAQEVPLQNFTRDLNLWSEGGDVLALQKYLNSHGFFISQAGPGSIGKETGLYGIKTLNAVVKLQEAHASEILIPAKLKKGTGIFGDSTRAFVNKQLQEIPL